MLLNYWILFTAYWAELVCKILEVAEKRKKAKQSKIDET